MSSRAPVQLDGASCLVCGVGGIGAAVANELERRAARLTLANRTVAGLAERHPAAVVVEADVCSPGGRERALSAAVEHGGGLDVLVCAVGVVAFGPVVELEESVARTLLEVNVLAPVMLAAAALPRLRAGGALVNISGVIAEQNIAGMAAYGASKAALLSFDRSLAREARRAGVSVIDARPPHTETGLAHRALAGEAPALATGITPARVAAVICDAVASGERDLPPEAFAAG